MFLGLNYIMVIINNLNQFTKSKSEMKVILSLFNLYIYLMKFGLISKFVFLIE